MIGSVEGWRAFADGGAEVAGVAHEEKSSDGFECVEEAEHAGLAFADSEGERVQEWAFESNPVGGGVHFVFGEFEFAVADVFVGKEFYFFEADDLGTDEDIAVGVKRG